MTNLLKTLESEKTDNLEKSIKPMHEFYDGTNIPYGSYDENHIFKIHYDATSRYGYFAKPIWGVAEPDTDGYKRYRIYIGEAPHKDENGKWTTYNDVPSFNIYSFAGADYIDKEPDIPHLINIETDEFYNKDSENNYNYIKKIESENNKLNQTIEYCSLKTYLNGLAKRFKLRFGYFSKYTGEKWKYIMYHYTRGKCWYLSLFKALDKSETYILLETDENLRYIYLKKNNKLCIKFEKTHNDNISCGC